VLIDWSIDWSIDWGMIEESFSMQVILVKQAEDQPDTV
jgi:hypothetical protein